MTPVEMAELITFLPAFEQPNREFITEWRGLQPIYAEDVDAFFKRLGHADWLNRSYQPAVASQQIRDDNLIAQADLATIETILTYCVRGERFSDGFWASLLENGRIQRLLRRLHQLHEK